MWCNAACSLNLPIQYPDDSTVENPDLAAQLLHQLAVNTKLRTSVKRCLEDITRYGGGDGEFILKRVKATLEKVLYET